MKIIKDINSKYVQISLCIEENIMQLNLKNINLKDKFIKLEISELNFESVYYFMLIENNDKIFLLKTNYNIFYMTLTENDIPKLILDDVEIFNNSGNSCYNVNYNHYFSLFDTSLENKVYANVYFYEKDSNNQYEQFYEIIEKRIPFISMQDYYFQSDSDH